MEICSEAEDLQTSKLNELKPNSGGDAQAASPTGNENLLIANGSIDPLSLELSEAPSKLSSSHLGGAISKEGRTASQAQANLAALKDKTKHQLTGKAVQANLPKSDGGLRKDHLR